MYNSRCYCVISKSYPGPDCPGAILFESIRGLAGVPRGRRDFEGGVKMLRTSQPKKRQRKVEHGFRKRMRTADEKKGAQEKTRKGQKETHLLSSFIFEKSTQPIPTDDRPEWSDRSRRIGTYRACGSAVVRAGRRCQRARRNRRRVREDTVFRGFFIVIRRNIADIEKVLYETSRYKRESSLFKGIRKRKEICRTQGHSLCPAGLFGRADNEI